IQQAEEEITGQTHGSAPTIGFELIRSKVPRSETLNDFFINKYDIRRLGIEAENLTYHQYQVLKEKLDFLQLIPTEKIILELRCIKSYDEIRKIRMACKIAQQAYNELLPLIKPGVSEIDLLCELEYKIKKNKGQVAFEPIIASGIRSSLPHARASNRVIQPQEPILIDWGVGYEGYNCDITRMIVPDDVSREIQDMYRSVKETQVRVIRMLKPGIKFDEINEAGKNILTQFGYGDFWMHKIGHGIGLEVHEGLAVGQTHRSAPTGDDEAGLMSGMVMTIEPGAYIPQLGGARVEDAVLITDEGCEVLTREIERE
ncbi:M24 family metallopeptidase, partial [Candidatus Desantisbacteria bacterium]|nr:M24 family metallopeptidase [Candidatus Desantisbacteria bacterium]